MLVPRRQQYGLGAAAAAGAYYYNAGRNAYNFARAARNAYNSARGAYNAYSSGGSPRSVMPPPSKRMRFTRPVRRTRRRRVYKKKLAKGFKTKRKVVRRKKTPYRKRVKSRLSRLERKVNNTLSKHHYVEIKDATVGVQENRIAYHSEVLNNKTKFITFFKAIPTQSSTSTVGFASFENFQQDQNNDSKYRIGSLVNTTIYNPLLFPIKLRVYVVKPKIDGNVRPDVFLKAEENWNGSYVSYEPAAVAAYSTQAPVSGSLISRHWFPSDCKEFTDRYNIVSTKNYYMKPASTRKIRYSARKVIEMADLTDPDIEEYNQQMDTTFLLFRIHGVMGTDSGNIAFDTLKSRVKIETEWHYTLWWDNGRIPTRTKIVNVEEDTVLIGDSGVRPMKYSAQQAAVHVDYVPT